MIPHPKGEWLWKISTTAPSSAPSPKPRKKTGQLIGGELKRFAEKLPDRLIAHLNLLRGDYGGFPVDRLGHCLQTATRAYQAGRDDEYVVCALLHDIGDTLVPLASLTIIAKMILTMTT
jgi:hypothetical protein